MNSLRPIIPMAALCATTFLIHGCSESETVRKSESGQQGRPAKDNPPASFDLVGSWQSPPRKQKPIPGEWGPTRITMNFTKDGKVESVVDFVEEQPGGVKLKHHGTYHVEGNVLHMVYSYDGEPDVASKTMLSRHGKYLVLTMDNQEIYVCERLK